MSEKTNNHRKRHGRLATILASWGFDRFTPSDEPTHRQLSVWVPLENAERLLVGTLSEEPGKFVFRYSNDFRARPDLPAIPAFPDRKETYECEELPAFFQVRLAPLDRADVERLTREKGLDQKDVLSRLAIVGRRAIATPYEFDLVEPSKKRNSARASR